MVRIPVRSRRGERQLYTLHPELSTVEQIGKYWYEYIWFVSLGVAGMFILGREAMRSR